MSHLIRIYAVCKFRYLNSSALNVNFLFILLRKITVSCTLSCDLDFIKAKPFFLISQQKHMFWDLNRPVRSHNTGLCGE